MGDPKKTRKKYRTPKNPWQSDQLSQELYLLGTYGLRNKRELWRAQTELSRLRKQTRALLAAPADLRAAREPQLLRYVGRLGLISEAGSVDDVLGLTIENVLERRLQTVVWRKGYAHTPQQARQMIVHGHIKLGDRIITIPSYLVRRDEDDQVRLREDSSFQQQLLAAPTEAASPATAT